jgi:predicted dinucleotide-binding enzyme
MRVGILGTGDVGKALGKGFITLGDDVKMSSREPKVIASARGAPRPRVGARDADYFT